MEQNAQTPELEMTFDTPLRTKAYYQVPGDLPARADDCVPGDLRRYLQACFRADEHVAICAEAVNGRPGKPLSFPVSHLIDQCRQPDMEAIVGETTVAGAWIGVNPVNAEGCRDRNITAYRHALLKSSRLEAGKQLAIIRQLELPCASILYSGNGTLHAIVRIEADSLQQYRERVDYLYRVAARVGLHCDAANRYPSRMTRLPGVRRGGEWQYTVSGPCGKTSWDEWYACNNLKAGSVGRHVSNYTVMSHAPEVAPEPWETPAPLGGLSEPPPPWPWDALPTTLRDMGQAIERTFNVSAEMAGAAVLGVASIALANKARVELKRDHRQFGNLFFLTVADVGGGKTPVTDAAKSPLVAWQRDRREEWDHACRDWEARKAVAEARIRGLEDVAKRYASGKSKDIDPDALQRDIARLKGQIGERPPEPVLFCADATSEALGRLMQERAGAIGVLSGEARKILAIAKGRYVEGGDIDLWLAGHAGDFLRVDRNGKDKPSYQIEYACLAAAIMTQPDSLQSLGEAECLRESGFLARWLYVIPDHNRGAYPVDSVPEDVAKRYAQAIRDLVDLPRAMHEDGTPAPHLVRLTPTAFDCWRAYHDATQAEIGATRETRPGSYLQWLSKLPEHVARLALLFHCCRHVGREPLSQIGPEEIEAAIRLAEVLKVHARRAFALMGADADTARARKVWTWLDRNRAKLRELREREGLPPVEAAKPRDLDRATVAGIQNATEAETVLLLLADKGHVQAVEVRADRAKPSHLFYLRPPDNPDKSDNGMAMSGKSGLSAPPEAEHARGEPDEDAAPCAEEKT